MRAADLVPAQIWPAAGALVCFVSSSAGAFDYLEHSFFSDRACLEAQRRLGPAAAEDEQAGARYLALSLYCPERWDRPYCADGYKQLEANLNRLAAPPAESGDLAITLGDISALPDHLTSFGPVRGLPRAHQDGLLRRTLGWLRSTGDAGGMEGDVAEDACETERPIDWPGLERTLAAAAAQKDFSAQLPASFWELRARAPLLRGAREPSAAYTFDNPQYLDMVRSNSAHFNPLSHETWTGFHATARRLLEQSCPELLALDDGDLEDLADGLSDFVDLDFGALPPELRGERGCAVLAERIRRRVLDWSERAEPSLVEPVRRWVRVLAEGPGLDRDALTRRLVPAVLSLVFEGAGLHFLQDGFAGGHVRVSRAALSIEESRYEHDFDSEHGVAAYVRTERRVESQLLFGDDFLLGRLESGARCDNSRLGSPTPELVTACVLERQQARVLLSTTASLLDWALPDGVSDADDVNAPRRCAQEGALPAFVCAQLPTAAPSLVRPSTGATLSRLGALPIPPPPFAYQSFLVSTSLDLAGGPPELGVRAVFLSSLGSPANWMTSYHFGLMTRLGGGATSQVLGEFSYMFHWRWAARFLVNAGPYAFAGLRGLGQGDVPFAGLGPNVGISLLPEGWILLPLEVTLSYRMPLRLLDGREGLTARIEAHWLELAVGLAFIH